MNKNLLTILGIALLCLACGIIGRLTAPKETITVTIKPNIDSLSSVILKGKMDSTTYAELLTRYRGLLENGHGGPTHDTAFILPETPIYTSSFTLDTLLPMNVTAIAEGDTMQVQGNATASIKVTYLGEAINKFALDNLSIKLLPYTIPIKRTEHGLDLPIDFSFKVLAGVSGGTPGLGAGIDIGPVALGTLYHTNQQFTFIAGWKIPIF